MVSVTPYDNAAVWGPVVVTVAIIVANLLAWALNERSWAYVHALQKVRVPKLLFISNRCAAAAAAVVTAAALYQLHSPYVQAATACVLRLCAMHAGLRVFPGPRGLRATGALTFWTPTTWWVVCFIAWQHCSSSSTPCTAAHNIRFGNRMREGRAARANAGHAGSVIGQH